MQNGFPVTKKSQNVWIGVCSKCGETRGVRGDKRTMVFHQNGRGMQCETERLGKLTPRKALSGTVHQVPREELTPKSVTRISA